MIKSSLKRFVQIAGLMGVVQYLRTGFNYTWREKIGERLFNIPYLNGISQKPSEPWMLEVLKKILKLREGVFIDVGVNLGQTLLKLRALDSRPYVGLEPNPLCVQYVRSLIKANKLNDCSVISAGLFDSDQLLSLDLYQAEETDSSASVIANFRQQPILSRMIVPVFRWASVERALKYDQIGVIKIDVEGAELEVVRTLRPALERDRPIVLAEVLPAYSANNLARLNRQLELEQIFKSLNYRLLRINKRRDLFVSFILVENLGVHGDLSQCDYIFSPQELLDGLDAEFDRVISHFVNRSEVYD